ncbi:MULTISPECIES: hypothetical protein [unclassified Streptomyces]|uniref:hypothetical protein n=1 Tax=unclassified Streptomyces TaxID=2593676 RepID=UPI002F9144D9
MSSQPGVQDAGTFGNATDDTARSGTSLLRSARLLRMGGARVDTALCVLDRNAGAAALLAGHHMVLRALVRDPDSAR